MDKVILFYGTRPELIKTAPIVWEFHRQGRTDQLIIIHTGQHTDTIDEAFLDIQPDIRLSTLKRGQDLASLTAALISEIGRCLEELVKDSTPIGAVLVQGDTTSAYCAALCAFYLHIPVLHLEAGFRSGDMLNPHPEEFYRRQISQMANLHFAPSEIEKTHLLSENIPEDHIVVSGNTVIDSLIAKIPSETVDHQSRNHVLITVHRRGNQNQHFRTIAENIMNLSRHYRDHVFIWLGHPAPFITENLNKMASTTNHFVQVRTHVPYSDMLKLYSTCAVVITDSGGVQEEASFLGIPTIVLRSKNERAALYEENHVFQSDPADRDLESAFQKALAATGTQTKLYGNGNSASTVFAAIQKFLVPNKLPQNINPNLIKRL